MRILPDGAGVIDVGSALVRVPVQCGPQMQFFLRYKPAAASQPIEVLTRPQEYMRLLARALARASLTGGQGDCRAATLLIVNPDNKVIARDAVRGQSGMWFSERESGQAQARPAEGTPPQPGMAPPAPSMSPRQGGVPPDRLDDFSQQMNQRARAMEQSRRSNPRGGYPPAADTGLDVPFQAVVAGAQDYAARQPVSFEGLTALAQVQATYEQWSRSSQQTYVQVPATRAAQQSLAVIEARRTEIETALKPQILAEMHKPGTDGYQFVRTLFPDRDPRLQSYRLAYYEPELVKRIPRRRGGQPPFYQRAGEAEKSNREAGQAAGHAKWSEPTANEIGLAMMRSLRAAGGRQIGPNVTTVPSVMNRFGIGGFDGMASVAIQFHEIDKGQCVRQSSGYLCGYTWYFRLITSGGASAFAGLVETRYGQPNSALLVASADGWRIPEFDRIILSGQITQLNQLTEVGRSVAQSASDAFGVMNDAASPPARGGGTSQMEQERQDRLRDAEDRRRGR